MKKIISTIIATTVITASALLALPTVNAEANMLSTDKTSYTEGESIMITATGSGTDWVGIYAKDDVTGSEDQGGVNSIYWYNVIDYTEPVDIKTTHYNSTREEYRDLPAGEYKICLFADGGYELIDRIEITVTANRTDNDNFQNTNPGTGDSNALLAAVFTAATAAVFLLKKKGCNS